MLVYNLIGIVVIAGMIVIFKLNKDLKRYLKQTSDNNSTVERQLDNLLSNHCHEITEKISQVEQGYRRLIKAIGASHSDRNPPGPL